jgi:hypothetical protein
MMNALKLVSGFLATSLLAGCASMDGAKGPRGPRLVGSGRATEYGQYAEIGVEFSSMNPVAWSEDAGRTGRILLGEAVVVGGVAAAAAGGGGGGSSGDGGISSGNTGPGSVGAPPSVPSGRPPE